MRFERNQQSRRLKRIDLPSSIRNLRQIKKDPTWEFDKEIIAIREVGLKLQATVAPKPFYKVQRASPHGKSQPRAVGRNNSNPNGMRDFDKQFASATPQLTKEEIERQKMLKYEELRRDLARQEQQERHQREDTVHIQQLKKRKVRKVKEQRKPLVKIQLPPFISVSNLATIMQVPLNDVFKNWKDWVLKIFVIPTF